MSTPMSLTDVAAQYSRLRSSKINAAINTLASVYYGNPANNSTVNGELDVLLSGETMSQLHVLRSIADVTAFLQAYSYQNLVLSANPVAYYRLNDAAGSTGVVDATGKNSAGTISGSITLGNAGALSGNAGTAAKFSGGNIVFPTNLKTDNWTGFSIVLWCNPTTIPSGYWRLAANDSPGSTHDGFELMVSAPGDGFGYFNVGYGGSSYNGLGGTGSTAAASTWYCYACTVSSSQIIMYLNGASIDSTTTSNTPIGPAHYPVTLGHTPSGGNTWNGYMQEVAIFAYPLSSSFISNLYAVGTGSF